MTGGPYHSDEAAAGGAGGRERSMAQIPKVATARARRQHYRENMLTGFDALAELYYAYWGEFFHLAVFEAGDDPADVAAVY
jgi:hypothetical protein